VGEPVEQGRGEPGVVVAASTRLCAASLVDGLIQVLTELRRSTPESECPLASMAARRI
jgi:hypothetical protein